MGGDKRKTISKSKRIKKVLFRIFFGVVLYFNGFIQSLVDPKR